MRYISYVIVLVVAIIFSAATGSAYGNQDEEKKKALWLNAGAFIIGFVVGTLYFA